jgi:hypothetical protein
VPHSFLTVEASPSEVGESSSFIVSCSHRVELADLSLKVRVS